MKNIKVLMLVLCGSFFLAQITYAQDDKSDAQASQADDPAASQAALEKAAQNPVASMVSVPFQDNVDFGVGPDDRVKNTLNIQPVIPVSISTHFNLIVRTIIPLISQPTYESDGSESTTTGLGNITLATYFTRKVPRKVIFGLGPVFGLPTATDEALGSKKWYVGPSLLLMAQPTGWTLGVVLQNTWSFAGPSDASAINLFYSQLIITKNLKSGWYIASQPIMTANWEAADSQQWTVPVGAGVGRVTHIGKQHINAQVAYYNNIVTPDNGGDWELRFQFTLMFPK